MDKLKEYMDKNREDFDRLHASDRHWDIIETRLDGNHSTKMQWFGIAATIMIFLLSGVIAYMNLNRQPAEPKKEAGHQINSLGDLNPHWAKVETFYLMSLRTEMQHLQKYNLNKYPQYISFLQQYYHVDSIYNSLVVEIREKGAQPEIIDQMIMNYKIRLKILEMLQHYLQEYQSLPTIQDSIKTKNIFENSKSYKQS